MKTRYLCVVGLILTVGATASAAPVERGQRGPVPNVTAPWLTMLRSGDPALRHASAMALMEVVRRHPDAASEVVRNMAAEGNGAIAAEHEKHLAQFAKESPATVSALIRLIRDKGTDYRARNFGVNVLSKVGPAVATPEFVDAMAETYCPVPGAFQRVLRAMGKEAAPILAAGYRHPDANVRKWSTNGLRTIARTEPTIQKLFDALQAEPRLLQKVREGTSAERIEAVNALADLARTTPGIATTLIHAVKEVTDKDVMAQAEARLIALGRASPEAVTVLVSGVRSKDDYRLRRLALKVLPKVGPALNCSATVEALGDHYCPVPGMMRRILIAAGQDALPVLGVAQKHANPDIRAAAEKVLQGMPRTTALAR